jgi:cell division protein FtsZ
VLTTVDGADMVFITIGLGGGTGTGAGPIIASLSTELGALTVAVVTKPFAFEGRHRLRQAEQGLSELRECVDTVITIPNERFLNTVPKGTSFYDSFRLVDDALLQTVQGITDLITVPGLINVDFADVKPLMEGMGMAFVGTGSAKGENRSLEALQRAISSPLMGEGSIEGARSLLVNLTGGPNVELAEVNEAMMLIRDAADPDAAIAFGVVIDERLTGDIKITVIATHFAAEAGSSRSVQGAAAMKARAYTLDDVRAKFDTLLVRMQTPEARRGLKAAFDLSSAQLGRAASKASRDAVEVSGSNMKCHGCGHEFSTVNGAGKSSIGGAAFRQKGGDYYNPDEAARTFLEGDPTMSRADANSAAWNAGVRLLKRAIEERLDYAFETTLGGKTIPRLLAEAASQGVEVYVWYVGLSSPELHIERVQARVRRGGHDIPEEHIRRRSRTQSRKSHQSPAQPHGLACL